MSKRSRWAFAMFLAACPACVGEATTGAPAKEAAPAVPAALAQMSAGASHAEGNNLFVNATFDEGTMLPWQVDFSAPAAGEARVEGGELCLHIQKGGANPYDVVLRQRPIQVEAGHTYQIRFKAHATAPTRLRAKIAQISAPYAERWSAVVPVSTEAQTFTGAFTAAGADPGAELAVHLGGDLTGQAPLTLCLDELELNDPAYQVPAERSAKPRSVVRVNQVGYLPGHHKLATVKSAATEPLDFQVVDAAGKVVLSGKTRPFGEDKAAGELDHLADFSSLRAPGKGYKLVVGKDESAPFDIGDDLYRKLASDALAFFYHQRSGIEIRCPWPASPERALARPGTPATPWCPAGRRRSAATRSTSPAAGTTRATTASTWSTPASPSGSSRTSTSAPRPSAATRRSWTTGSSPSPRARTASPTCSTRPAGRWSGCSA